MQMRTWAAVAFTTLTVAACATGPQLSYPEFLPNTNEDPAWARNTAQPVMPPAAPAPAAAPTR
ncbi:MAG TPA: hypothetical protein VFC24_01560 [Casimicrobiaceae bacterium]|nr:hypothetical protein [Casimicrobiaceae bacterium]